MAQKTPDVAPPSPGARWVPGVWNPSSQARGLWLTKPQTRVSGLGISSLALPLCKMWRVVVPNFLLSRGTVAPQSMRNDMYRFENRSRPPRDEHAEARAGLAGFTSGLW